MFTEATEQSFRIVPVINDYNQHLLCVKHSKEKVVINGKEVETAPIKANGEKFDLIGISSPSLPEERNIVSLNPSLISVEGLVLEFETGAMEIDLNSNFTEGPFGHEQLWFAQEQVTISLNYRRPDLPPELHVLQEKELTLTFKLSLSGQINIETGECSMFLDTLEVTSLEEGDGNIIDKDDAVYQEIKSKFESAQAGVRLKAYTTVV